MQIFPALGAVSTVSLLLPLCGGHFSFLQTRGTTEPSGSLDMKPGGGGGGGGGVGVGVGVGGVVGGKDGTKRP